MQEPATREEFERYVIPHVRLLGRWPGFPDLQMEQRMVADIWDCLQTEPEWRLQSMLFDNWGILNFDTLYVALGITGALNAFQAFKYASHRNIAGLHIVRDRHACDLALPKAIPIADLADEYAIMDDYAMLIPFPQCPHNSNEGGGVCTCSLLPGIEIQEGDDPGFAAYLQKLWYSA